MIDIIRDILALGLFVLGTIFGLGGVAALWRFPDPYTRLQGGSLAGTTAPLSIFLGALVLAPSLAIAGRILVIILFFLLSSPTGAHLVARFTWNSGVEPWSPRRRSKP